jgi:hypothetical protein
MSGGSGMQAERGAIASLAPRVIAKRRVRLAAPYSCIVAARFKVSISSFFICITAASARSERAESSPLNNSISILGTTCHEAPNLSAS